MRTALFCVDWKTENSVSYQIRVGKSIKPNPVCTSLGWQIITSIPCFTLSATHASLRSGATASAFITATLNPCRVSMSSIRSVMSLVPAVPAVDTGVALTPQQLFLSSLGPRGHPLGGTYSALVGPRAKHQPYEPVGHQ